MLSFQQQNIRTLCYCWVITRTDGVKLGFTDHDQSLHVDGIDCQPETGMVTGSSEIESGFSINGGQVEAALNADAISIKDILSGLFDRATIQHYLVNWLAPENIQLLRTMTVAKVTQSNGQFIAEMDGLLSGFDAPQGRHFRRQCDAELGDGKCGVDLNISAFSYATTSEGEANGTSILVAAPDKAETEFQNGSININGFNNKIANIRANGSTWLVELSEPLKQSVSENTTCMLHMGCNKSFETCKSRFNNHINFRGFPHLPGGDAAYQFAKSDDVFDGEPIVS